jgi:hypothetical protein
MTNMAGWTIGDLEAWAMSEFKDDFLALPGHASLEWQPFSSDGLRDRHGEYTEVMIVLGRILADTPGKQTQTVSAIFHKTQRRILYLYRDNNGDMDSSQLRENVILSDPFRRVYHGGGYQLKLRQERFVSALVWFYFLSAGMVRSMDEYPHGLRFMSEFKLTCAAIPKTSTPLNEVPQSEGSNRDQEVTVYIAQGGSFTLNQGYKRKCSPGKSIYSSYVVHTGIFLTIFQDHSG